RNQEMTRASRPLWQTYWRIFESRRAALETGGLHPYVQILWAGTYRDALPLEERFADAAVEQGKLANAAVAVAVCSRLHAALGDLASAERDLVRFAELAKRAGNPPIVVIQRGTALFDVAYSRGTGLELGASRADASLARDDPAGRVWGRASGDAVAAVLFTFAGRDQDALRALARAMPPVEGAGGGVASYPGRICRCCEALGRFGRADFADVLERNLLDKTLAGDFRELGVDARLAMAQLCALTGRPGEAHRWFERARAVLDEQGAPPLLALVDLDEAWMEIRRGPHGDRDRARALLDVACEQFQAIGMPGWIERAEALRASASGAAVAGPAGGPPPEAGGGDGAARGGAGPAHAALRCEGDYWTVAYGDVVARVKDLKGLHYLAHLLRSPGQEFHVLDLIGQDPGGAGRGDEHADGPLPLLDAEAKAAYRRRLG